MLDKMQENCAKHMEHSATVNARLGTTVSRLCDDMKGVNTFLLKGNGRSISERLVAVETTLAGIEKKLDKMNGGGVERFAFWRTVLRAVFGI